MKFRLVEDTDNLKLDQEVFDFTIKLIEEHRDVFERMKYE